MIEASFAELEGATGTKGACLALGRSRASLYRHRRGPLIGPPRPRPVPLNALSGGERDTVLSTLHEARFVDRAPAQVWATLLDEGSYLGSPSTMYRVLRSAGEVRERRRIATHPPRTIPELVATRPNEVWSYDTTRLVGPVRGVKFSLFAMLDIYSRYCCGHIVLPAEDGEAVRDWISSLVTAAGPMKPGSLTIHSDNGGPMICNPLKPCLKMFDGFRSRNGDLLGTPDKGVPPASTRGWPSPWLLG